MQQHPKIAILGAGGMLGHKMYTVLSREFPQTYACFRKSVDHYSRFGVFAREKCVGGVDVRSESALLKRLDELRPDAIINCVGLTTRKLGDQRESDIILVNSVLPHVLKDWAIRNGKKLIHFSTDCVFSGKSGPYADDSFKDAKDLYGQSKSLGEVGGTGVLTIRSSIVGLELEGKTELIEWFLSQSGRRIKGFTNVMYSGVTTTTMASAVCKLLKSSEPFGGVHQLASEPVSKFDLLSIANQAFDARVIIEAVTEPVSNKVLIQSSFFNDRKIHPKPWSEQFAEIAAERAGYGLAA